MKKRKKKDRLLNGIIKLLIIIIILLVLFLVGYDFFVDKSKDLKIKLNGKKEVVINFKEEYKDKGAKATYKDKDISKKIKIDNKLDANKVGKYKITYTIKYEKMSKKVIRVVKVVDKVEPKIGLEGPQEITIEQGQEYKEEGAKAVDDYDGDITNKIKTEGSVDTSKVDEYKITYSVKDSSGNKASIERVVKVIEKKQVATNDKNTKYIGETPKGFTIEQKDGLYYIGGILIVNKSYGLPKDYNPGGLLNVFSTNFNKMKSAASKEGISLSIISGFRSYTKQTNTYNRYVSQDGKEKADTYSARPGYSEHQTGLAADINSLSQSWGDTKEGKWLSNNCYKYGFIIRYIKGKESITGYMYEPWHIRYVGVELATKLYNNGSWIALEEYLGIDSKYK